MTKTLILLLTLLASLNLLGQSFEGKITYQNSYKSKLPNITDQQWSAMMGSTQNYFIKEANYRSDMNGTVAIWQLYINSENKLYNKIASSEAILWNDAALNFDEVLKVETGQNALEILGYKCDELTLVCKSGVQKYYFAPALIVDSKRFVNHKFGNWYEYISRAKSLPLKIVVDNAQFTMESLATEVKPMQLDNSLFVLPSGAQTTKSPY